MVPSTWYIAYLAVTRNDHKIEYILAIDVFKQCLKILMDRNAIFDLNSVIVILAIFVLALTIGMHEHPTE